MKNLKFFAATLAVVAILASCAKDQSGNDALTGGKTTIAKVVLSQNGNSTRAHDGSATPTASESNVNTATLYVFNTGINDVRVLEKIVAMTVTAGVAAPQVFEITTGMHYFYAAINIPAAQLTGITEGITTLEAFERKLVSIAAIADATTTDAFWMTNVETSSANLIEATQAEAQAGTKNAVTINVGRAVAKVGFDFEPVSSNGGVLSTVQYKIHNNPNRIYLMPVIESSIWKSSFWTDVTPIVAANYFNNAAYLNAGNASVPCTELCYTAENTNDIPREGNSTLVMIKGKFTPAAVFMADGVTAGALNANGDFWRVANVIGGVPTSYTSKYYMEEPAASEILADQLSFAYPGGICYYGVWLESAINEYDVMRNRYYWVTITSVSGAGSSTEQGVVPDPNEPLVVDTWIEATIEIRDWVLINQETGI